MINYILLVITIACTIFNVWLTLKDREGYDKGLEDGIRMTNEVLEEDQTDKVIYDGNGTRRVIKETDCPWR